MDDRIDHVSGFNAFDLCTAENCTALECGLPDSAQQCNQTSLICSDYYLGCLSGKQAHADFYAENVGASDPDINFKIEGYLNVSWEMSASPYPAGGAKASRGVHSGECQPLLSPHSRIIIPSWQDIDLGIVISRSWP